MQHQRQVLLVFVVAAILSGITVQAASVSLFESLAVPDTRIGGLFNFTTLLSVGVGAVVFGVLIRTQQAITYVDEVVDELRKVTWPTREEAVRAATTVVFTALLVASLIGLYDLLWKNVADVFLFNEG